jgi:hypothetical protein
MDAAQALDKKHIYLPYAALLRRHKKKYILYYANFNTNNASCPFFRF